MRLAAQNTPMVAGIRGFFDKPDKLLADMRHCSATCFSSASVHRSHHLALVADGDEAGDLVDGSIKSVERSSMHSCEVGCKSR
jgi:hypothetical protein